MYTKKQLPDWAKKTETTGLICRESCVYIILLLVVVIWGLWGIYLGEAGYNSTAVHVLFWVLFVSMWVAVFVMSYRLHVIPNSSDRSNEQERVTHETGIELPWTKEQFLTIFLFILLNLLFYGCLTPMIIKADYNLFAVILFSILNLVVFGTGLVTSPNPSQTPHPSPDKSPC